MVHCSIIIPHYNQSDYLQKCLEALAIQKVDGYTFDIIIVDNGSTNIFLPKFSPNLDIRLVNVQEEKNPYMCRNEGIRESKGEIVGFLDAKCLPCPEWLQRGMEKLESFDLVAGSYNVETNGILSSKVFPLLYLNSAKNIQRDYGVTTGNLFVRKAVFEKVGYFNTESKSGNDILFTKEAMKHGFKIGLCEEAVVTYPKKSFKSLIIDMFKYGKGAYITRQKSLYSVIPYLLPMRISSLKEAIQYRKYNLSVMQKVKVWLFIWWAKLHFAAGILVGFMDLKSKLSIK